MWAHGLKTKVTSKPRQASNPVGFTCNIYQRCNNLQVFHIIYANNIKMQGLTINQNYFPINISTQKYK